MESFYLFKRYETPQQQLIGYRTAKIDTYLRFVAEAVLPTNSVREAIGLLQFFNPIPDYDEISPMHRLTTHQSDLIYAMNAHREVSGGYLLAAPQFIVLPRINGG